MRKPGTKNRHTKGAVVGTPERSAVVGVGAKMAVAISRALDEHAILPEERKRLLEACHGRGPEETLSALRALYRRCLGCRLPLVERGECQCSACSGVRRGGYGWSANPFSPLDVTEGRPAVKDPAPIAFVRSRAEVYATAA